MATNPPFIPALQPPIEQTFTYTGVAATIYITDFPAPDPAMMPLAVNPATISLADPSAPLSPHKPL